MQVLCGLTTIGPGRRGPAHTASPRSPGAGHCTRFHSLSVCRFVGIELRRSASFGISAGLIGEPAQGALGTRGRLSPAFLILNLAEKPPRNPVLFLGR